jgi:hypothetical protein
MALIIEDGTIVANANSFITVAEWEAYLTLYGKQATGTEADKETSLIKAQRAISTRYTFDGALVEQAQATCLPRNWTKNIKGFTVASNIVPQDFKDAQAELAFDIQGGADPFANATEGAKGPVLYERAKAGPAETQTQYGSGGAPFNPRSMANYTSTNDLLRPYLAAGASGLQVRMERG